jgi:lactate permease
MGGWSALRRVFVAAAVCGISFATAQILISNFVGPYLTDIIASITAIVALIILFHIWKPSELAEGAGSSNGAVPGKKHSARDIVIAWSPYGLLVVFVLVWGIGAVKGCLESATVIFNWPRLHELVLRIPPVVAKPAPYAAKFTLNLLSISGTACMFAALGSSLILQMPVIETARIIVATGKQMFHTFITISGVVAMAFLMNYSGATVTLALALAATGSVFPFLGWLGVFLSGSDTASNALFGNLQVVTANQLGVNPVLMAAANSSGGVMGKMISLQSIAVAAAATGLRAEDEGKLFRFTLKHSILLVSLMGLLTLFYAYVAPGWVK